MLYKIIFLRHRNTSFKPILIQKSVCIYIDLQFLDPGSVLEKFPPLLTLTISIKVNVLITSKVQDSTYLKRRLQCNASW